MKLIDLLEPAKKTGDIIKNKNFKHGIIYSNRYHLFLWCDENGKAVESVYSFSGYKAVNLRTSLFSDDNWYLEPTQNSSYKIGRYYNVEYTQGNGEIKTFYNMLVDDKGSYYQFESMEYGADIIKKDTVRTMICMRRRK